MSAGDLFVVGTPIGNLGDWSPRAHEVLADVDLIACEDTRRTGLLLSRHGIANPGMVVANDHTEVRVIDRILDVLNGGGSVAVVSDAGMPTISDPGALLVEAVAAAGHNVVVVPGPTAVSSALAVSGFAGNRFVFEGFLPPKKMARASRLAAMAGEERMVVFYEAPHRVVAMLADLVATFGAERRVAVARELTKMHEEVWRGTLGAAADGIGEPRGEYVIVVDQAPPADEADDETLDAAIAVALERGLSTRDAAAEVATAHGVSRRRVYELAVNRRADSDRSD